MEEKSDQKRSPRYPAISLKEAIDSARSIWNKEKRTPIQGGVLAKALGYSSFSGPVRTKLASLRQYDLLEKHADGVRLSDLAMRIIHNPENSADYKKAVQEAALSPELFRELHASHSDASDDAVRSYLILKKGFSDAGARLAAAAYKDNLSLANTNDSGCNGEDEHEEEKSPLKVGDYVQWESQGVLQFSAPCRVRELSEDGEWAFVDGSNTGLPVSELTLKPKPESAPLPPRPRTWVEAMRAAGENSRTDPAMRQDVFSLAEGQVLIQWPSVLSKESYEDLVAWLKILERKIGRSVPDTAPPAKTVIAEG